MQRLSFDNSEQRAIENGFKLNYQANANKNKQKNEPSSQRGQVDMT